MFTQDRMFNALPLAVLVWTVPATENWEDCVLDAFNATAAHLVLRDKDVAIGSKMGDLFPTPTMVMPRYVMAAHEAQQEVRVTHDLSDDKYLVASYYEIVCTPIGNGQVMATLTDVSELEHARRKVQEDLSMHTDLLSYVFHDLTGPIRSASLLLDRAVHQSQQNDARLQDTLDKSADVLHTVGALVRSLDEYRSLSALQRNGIVSLEDCLNEALSGVAELAQVELHRTSLPEVRTNRFAVVTVFRNLIGNSIKYARPDVKPVISVAAEEVGDYWEIHVTDNGLGFDPQYAEEIFRIGVRLYKQGDKWGNGIGLSNCRAAIASQGGFISAHSEGQNKGARFTFTIPKVENPPC